MQEAMLIAVYAAGHPELIVGLGAIWAATAAAVGLGIGGLQIAMEWA